MPNAMGLPRRSNFHLDGNGSIEMGGMTRGTLKATGDDKGGPAELEFQRKNSENGDLIFCV